MPSRIYLVEFTNGTKKLVDATSQWQAIRHCVRGMVAAKAANASDVASYMSGGGTIEKAHVNPKQMEMDTDTGATTQSEATEQ